MQCKGMIFIFCSYIVCLSLSLTLSLSLSLSSPSLLIPPVCVFAVDPWPTIVDVSSVNPVVT